MGVETISAVTLAVTDMARSVVFYRDHVGLELLYGAKPPRSPVSESATVISM